MLIMSIENISRMTRTRQVYKVSLFFSHANRGLLLIITRFLVSKKSRDMDQEGNEGSHDLKGLYY